MRIKRKLRKQMKLMRKGNILGKWNANDLPNYEIIKEEYLK